MTVSSDLIARRYVERIYLMNCEEERRKRKVCNFVIIVKILRFIYEKSEFATRNAQNHNIYQKLKFFFYTTNRPIICGHRSSFHLE